MGCGPTKERTYAPWCSPLMGVMKFNVDGASRGKPGSEGNRGVLHGRGEVLLMFSQHIGVRDSNETEELVIPAGLRLFSRRFIGFLVMESNSSNAIAWVSNRKSNP